MVYSLHNITLLLCSPFLVDLELGVNDDELVCSRATPFPWVAFRWERGENKMRSSHLEAIKPRASPFFFFPFLFWLIIYYRSQISAPGTESASVLRTAMNLGATRERVVEVSRSKVLRFWPPAGRKRRRDAERSFRFLADHVPLESENTSQSRSSQSFCLMSRRRLTKACSFPVITAGACESGGNVYCGWGDAAPLRSFLRL